MDAKYLTTEQSAALKRNLSAVQRIILNIRAHDEIRKVGEVRNINFIALSRRALYNDMASQAMNVLDGHKNAGSFWWLYKQKKCDIDIFVKEKNINWALLDDISDKLKKIRDKTHFHFSREYVLDYKKVWKNQDIKGDDFLTVINSIWEILSFLAEKQPEILMPNLEYDGEDAKKSAKFVLGLYGVK